MRRALRYWRLYFLAGLVMSGALAYHFGGLKEHFSDLDVAQIRSAAIGRGWLGVAVFMAVYIGFVTLGVPNLPLQLLCGAVYGTWSAYAMMYVGVNIGALTAFTLGRWLGRKSIEELLGHRLKGLNAMLERGGFRLLLILRLTPLMPFNSINYGSGISRIGIKTYVTANLIGTIPLTLLHVCLGDAAGTLDLKEPASWAHPKIAGPILITAALSLGVLISGQKLRRQRAALAPRLRSND